MRTVEKFERIVALAESMGYRIRYEPLAGTHGGVCEFGGNRWLFVDLGLNVDERLELVTDSLREDPSLPVSQLDNELLAHFGLPIRAVA